MGLQFHVRVYTAIQAVDYNISNMELKIHTPRTKHASKIRKKEASKLILHRGKFIGKSDGSLSQ